MRDELLGVLDDERRPRPDASDPDLCYPSPPDPDAEEQSAHSGIVRYPSLTLKRDGDRIQLSALEPRPWCPIMLGQA
jgi:hypothetical protein